MQIAVRCLQGFEFLLKQELEQLGVTELKEGNRVVQGSCELEDLYKVNYCSRLALRVLVPVHAYSFANIDEFYLNALNFAWEEWFDEDTTFAIDPQVSSMQFRHAHFASLKLKDAIADRLRKVYGSRPNVDTENPNVQIHLLVNKDRVQISMDSSGRSLNQRGYRKSGGEAPMNEVLAAGMIRQSGWKGEKSFYNPFAGSGTLLIEAAYVAFNWPAQYLNRSFNFQTWKNYSDSIWKEVLDKAHNEINSNITVKLWGSDIDEKQLSVAWKNIAQLPKPDCIDLVRKDFFEDGIEHENEVVFINPPYGERMEIDDLNAIYKQLGHVLKHHYNGCEVWLISSDTEALHAIGLRPKKKLKTLNGKLDCEIRGMDLFSGTMKSYKTS